MGSLILLIIFALGAAFFATQNTGSVHLLLGGFMVESVPLYIVVIGSILLGVFISWLISIVDTFSTMFTLHGKDAALKAFQKKIEELQERNHELEMKLATSNENLLDEETLAEKEEFDIKPPLLYHLKQRLNVHLP